MTLAQKMQPHEALAGTAAAFLIIAETYNVSVQKALEVAGRAMNDARKTKKGEVQIGAISDLLQNELEV